MRIFLALGLLCLSGAALAAPEVVRLTVGSGLSNKQPIGEARAFPTDGGKVVAWAQFRNPGRATTVTWSWRHDGVVVSRKTSKVPDARDRWRTWSRLWMHPKHAGHWRVALLSAEDQELGAVEFTVGAVEAHAAPEPSAPDPSAPEPTAPEISKPKTSPRARPKTCRAWINLRRRDGRLQVVLADLDHPKRTARSAPGLVVLDDGKVYALRKTSTQRTLRNEYGRVEHRWDMLLGRQVPDGPVVTWAGMPARLPPLTARPLPRRPRHEVNLINIHSVIGPYVGLRQGLSGDTSTGINGFDNSRFRTVIAPGQTADPTILVGADLLPRALMRTRTLWLEESPTAPKPIGHDYRRAALEARPDGVRLLTLIPCCTWPQNRGHLLVDVPVHPPAPVLAHLPDALGWWRAQDGCGQVRLQDGQLEGHRTGSKIEPLRLRGSRPDVILGVAWPGALEIYLEDIERAGRILLE